MGKWSSAKKVNESMTGNKEINISDPYTGSPPSGENWPMLLTNVSRPSLIELLFHLDKTSLIRFYCDCAATSD